MTDITLSSFFSLHRPLSLTKPLPPAAEQAAFDQIFEPSPQPAKSQDVLHTLSNTLDTLENASSHTSDNDLRWQVIQESASNSDGNNGVRHLDSRPQAKSIEEMVSRLRPFSAPPAPMSMEEAQANAAKKEKSGRRSASSIMRQQTPTQQQVEAGATDRTYKTTLIVHETTGSNGKKYWSAQTTPAIDITNSEESDSARLAQRGDLQQIEEPAFGLREIQEPRQPFLDRMRDRRSRYAEYNPDQAQRKEDERLAISVKRQRKLKMKKHKYKKLMKRTRNLRRRLDRN